MLCSTTYRYFIHNFLDAVQKISVKFSGGYFSDTLLGGPDGNRRVLKGAILDVSSKSPLHLVQAFGRAGLVLGQCLSSPIDAIPP